METQNTMEEKKTITIEEAQEAIELLRTFTEQHKENSALFLTLISGRHISMCSRGTKSDLAASLSLYAVASEVTKKIIQAVAVMLEDDSEEGGGVPRPAQGNNRQGRQPLKKFGAKVSENAKHLTKIQ